MRRMATVAAGSRGELVLRPGLDEQLLAWLPGIALAIVAAQTVGHLVDWLAFDLRYGLLDADSDVCAYAWIATIGIFLSAAGVFVLDRFRPPRGLRRWLAPALAFLSLDEMVAIHEHLNRVAVWLGFSGQAGRVVWPVVYLPLIGGVALLLWHLAGELLPAATLYVRGSLALLGASVLLEMGSTKLADGQHGRWLYELEVIVEQNFEVVGWALIGLALAAIAVRVLSGRPLA